MVLTLKRTALAPKKIRARVGMPVRTIRARFDAAQTNAENSRHWGAADGLSADSAASPGVRRILRNRARYEVANNTYASGLVETLANDCIGTGPRLQMLGSTPEKDKSFVEAAFAEWMIATDLAEKLRTMRMARSVDGEAFGMMISNPGLETPVQLDLRLIEADQCASVALNALTIPSQNAVDGIKFDEAGNPTIYEVLKEHPGSGLFFFGDAVPVPANRMLHLFLPKRPGQRRGIPELTPALALFAQLRRWTLSVLGAAETASDFSALMYTEAPAGGEAPDAEPFDTLQIERRMMMTLPSGWKMSQLKAEQPVSTYSDFKLEILNEIARCLHIPSNVARGNSSGYNYASGRLDHQTYFKSLKVDRVRLVNGALNRLFTAWRKEAVLVEGFLPQSFRSITTDWAHTWFWDGNEHVDPQKEANAQDTRLKNFTTTLSDEYGKIGLDWEERLEQISREKEKMDELGLTPAVVTNALQQDKQGAQDKQQLQEMQDQQDETGA